MLPAGRTIRRIGQLKHCPNCGGDVQISLSKCCVENRSTKKRTRNSAHQEAGIRQGCFTYMNEAEVGKYSMLKRKPREIEL